MNNKNIFFLGCGKMGQIIVKNLLQNNILDSKQLLILKPTSQNLIPKLKYIHHLNDIDQNYQADIVFLCTKPQNSAKILTEFSKKNIFHPKTIFISIMAGKNYEFFVNFFGKNAEIIRSMPNLGIAVNKSIVPLYSKNLSKENKIIIEKIFDNFGKAFFIEDEELFHIYTALYGCGPALIFLLQEILEQIAIKNNIPKNLANDLTKILFASTAEISQNSTENFAELRQKVTSKKGVTASMLKNLIKNNKLQNLLQKSISNAVIKSKRLN